MSVSSFGANGIRINECIHNIYELNWWYHFSCRTTLSRAFTRRGENNRGSHADTKGGSDGETPQISFVFRCKRDALWYPFSLCLHRQPLCRRIIGFTHDDKVEHSHPAIVKVASFLIIACGRKSQEKLSFSITQRVPPGALGQPRVIGVAWCNREKKDYSLRVITSAFPH